MNPPRPAQIDPSDNEDSSQHIRADGIGAGDTGSRPISDEPEPEKQHDTARPENTRADSPVPVVTAGEDAGRAAEDLGTIVIVESPRSVVHAVAHSGGSTDKPPIADDRTVETEAAAEAKSSPQENTFVYVRSTADDEHLSFDELKDSLTSRRAPEQRIFGRIIGEYELEKELGRGGMGVVFLARHRTLQRRVALKMVLSGRYSSADAVARFLKEAQSVAKLQNPGIVQIFDIGEHIEQDGNPLVWFALEFVEGGDLQKKLKGEPQSAAAAAEMALQLADTMQYAHESGILHRDLKPANILLDTHGKPKISDFGLAREVDSADAGLTGEGVIVGSPSYMPPEQARGELSSLSPRSDLYSLGAILYQMLTGRPPYLTDSAVSTILQVLNADPVQPRQLQPGIPIDLETICMKALQKDAASRYTSCRELAADLGRFLKGEPILARPISRSERLWRWCRRNPGISVSTAASVFLLLTTALISTFSFLQISAQAEVITQERDEANVQRNEAERQTILATEAQLQAERNQKLAEQQALLALKNIQFIVTDIDDRLAKQPGMAEIRIALLQVVEQKWDELDLGLAGGIQGEAVPTLMAVRGRIAEAWISLDRLQEADRQYAALHARAKERVIIKNRSDASRFNQAVVCVRWAPVRQRLTGDPAEAEKLNAESEELMRDILRDPRPEPGSPGMYQISDILQQSLMRTAATRMKSGRPELAQRAYEEAQAVNQNVLNAIAADAEWYTTLPEDRRLTIRRYFEQNTDLARAGLANIMVRNGLVDDAEKIFSELIDRQQASVAAQPDDLNAASQLALQYRNFGQQMLRANRVDKAVRLIGKAHDLTEKNHLADPGNAPHRQAHGYSLYYWAVALETAGQSDLATALLERARVLRQQMFDESPDQSNRVNLMLTEARLGRHEECLKLIEDLKAVEAKNPDLRIDIARALAQLSRFEPDKDKQELLLNNAADTLEQAVDDGLSDAFALTAEVDLRPLLGNQRFNDILTRLTSTP